MLQALRRCISEVRAATCRRRLSSTALIACVLVFVAVWSTNKMFRALLRPLPLKDRGALLHP